MVHALALACLIAMTPLSAQALAIEAPFDFQGQVEVGVSALVMPGLSFEPDTGAPPDLSGGRLFEGFVLSQSEIGSTVFADGSAGEAFAHAVASLTDGLPSVAWLELTSVPGSPLRVFYGFPEHSLFGSGDLAGQDVLRIGFRLDQISFTPRDDSDEVIDYAISGTLLFETTAVAEPSAAALVVLAVGAMIALRARA